MTDKHYIVTECDLSKMKVLMKFYEELFIEKAFDAEEYVPTERQKIEGVARVLHDYNRELKHILEDIEAREGAVAICALKDFAKELRNIETACHEAIKVIEAHTGGEE